MKERNKYGGFSEEVKKTVKEAQNGQCHYCGREACLEVHHIIPKSQHKEYGLTRQEIHCRHNAVGLCNGCHQLMDNLALQEGITYPEVLMEEGIDYPLPRKFWSAIKGTQNPVHSLDAVRQGDRFVAFYDDPGSGQKRGGRKS